MTSKLPDIPEPVTLKIRDIEKLKVVELKDALNEILQSPKKFTGKC